MDRLYDIEHRVQTARALATIRSRLRGRYRAPTLQGVRSRLAGWRRFSECAGYGFWRLDAARAAQEQTQGRGPNADAENEDGELDLRKRVFPLFLPYADDHGGKARQQSH